MGNFVLDLPKDGNLSPPPIPTEAYTERPELGDEDLLHREIPKLVRLFAKEVHPTLTSKRRIELWCELLARLPAGERSLMEHIRTHRSLPFTKISSGIVEMAFPDMLDTPPEPDKPVPGITYGPSTMTNPTPIAERPAPQAARAMSPEEARYAALMRAHGWESL
jgi:hypothetical protein